MNRTFILDLAKLMAVAAWADGELSNDEVNALKELLFSVDEVTGAEWREISILLEKKPSPEEADGIVARVASQAKSKQAREMVVKALERLFESDGDFSAEEKRMLRDVEAELESGGGNLMAPLKNLFGGLLRHRTAKMPKTESNAKLHRDNVVLFDLVSSGAISGEPGPEMEKMKKATLAAGLLALVAGLDSGVSEEEKHAIADILAEAWGLSGELSKALINSAAERAEKGELDYYRLTRGYFEISTMDERSEFIKLLFRVANASEGTCLDEIEEIARVAKSLKLPHKVFIDAKLTIPREDRKGL